MKQFLLILFSFLIIHELQCQIKQGFSKIYLADGSVYIGKIVDFTPNVDIVVQLNDTNTFHIPNTLIKKIRRIGNAPKYKIDSPYEFKEKGFYNVSYASLYSGNGSDGYSALGLGFSSTFGYMFNKYFGLGLGLGCDKLDFLVLNGPNFYFSDYAPESSFTSVYPLFIEARGYFFGQNRAYYYSVNAGYGFASKDKTSNVTEINGGFMLHPAVGIRFTGHKHFNLCLDFGLKFQKLDYVVPNYFEDGKDHFYIGYKRFILRVGMQI